VLGSVLVGAVLAGTVLAGTVRSWSVRIGGLLARPVGGGAAGAAVRSGVRVGDVGIGDVRVAAVPRTPGSLAELAGRGLVLAECRVTVRPLALTWTVLARALRPGGELTLRVPRLARLAVPRLTLARLTLA
jgi:hypothetical protein